MIKKLAFLATGVLASYAAAATAVVWSDQGEKVAKDPAYFYTFAYEEGSGAAIDTTNVNGAKVLDFSVPMGKTSAGAGYGFAWQQNTTTYKDVAVSLSAYKGACIVYEAEAPFRVDFKQSTITDDNYYGYELPAAATSKKLFVPFANLTQGWKSSTTKAWAVSSQTGVQFSYKNTHANTAKTETNAVILHSFTLADECITAAPNVTEGFKGYNGGAIDLKEGAIHTMNMPEVFEDADGDDLVITVKIVSETKSVKLVDSTAYTGKSTIQFTTASNPEGPATVTLTATDPTKKTATFSFTINTVDTENLPVAKDFSFEVLEDSSYKNGLTEKGFNLNKLCFDADGDTALAEIVDMPAHGNLDYAKTGIFTYAPEANYFGSDSFTYRCYERDVPSRVGDVATVSITVTPVNDAPTISFSGESFVDGDGNEYAYGDTLVVDEDFEKFVIGIPEENVSVTDPDGDDDIVIMAKSSGVVAVNMSNELTGFHGIEVSAVKDANGVAKITLAAGDHKITKSLEICYVKVNPVADAPSVKDDEYTIPQDSLFKVSAKNGVLANDPNPDSIAVKTVLEIPAEHGEVVLAADGSFTYKSEEGYADEDAFAYKLVYGDGEETNMAIVTINVVRRNHAPAIVEGVLDTVSNRLAALKEDFTTTITYKKAEMQTWFIDDTTAAAKLTFTARSEDSLLNVSFSSVGALQIKSVKNACGDAVVYLTAKDERGAATDLPLQASIECVNDKPIALYDTVYIPLTGTSLEYDVTKLATDVDGDELSFEMVANSNNGNYFAVEFEDNTLKIELNPGYVLIENLSFEFRFKVTDPTIAAAVPSTFVTTKLFVIVGDDPRTSIKPVIAAPKANWQSAILANRGVAAMFDMQGRVMWKQKLPVSEAEVRAAASSIQGRKILQVNKQTYTIK